MKEEMRQTVGEAAIGGATPVKGRFICTSYIQFTVQNAVGTFIRNIKYNSALPIPPPNIFNCNFIHNLTC